VTLYIPHGHEGPFAWRVLQDSNRVGAFMTQDEAVRFALRLAGSIHHYHGVAVHLRLEDEKGTWEAMTAFSSEEPRDGAAIANATSRARRSPAP
jgi:hypothetical protein